MDIVSQKMAICQEEACIDYAFHCCITDLNDGEILNEMEVAVKAGITSF